MNWRFTLVLIKINYGQIEDQTRLFYTSGNRFVRRTGTFGNLIFSLVPSDNRNTRSTCPTSVFTGIGQTLMSRPEFRSHDLSFNLFPVGNHSLGHMICLLIYFRLAAMLLNILKCISMFILLPLTFPSGAYKLDYTFLIY